MKYSEAIIECNKRILKAEMLRDEYIEKIRILDEEIEAEVDRILLYQMMQKKKHKQHECKDRNISL